MPRWIEADAYLFDIDGTLLNARGGAHYHAFHSALQHGLGLDCRIDGVPWHGSTDISILRAVASREGASEKRFEENLPAMLEHMNAEVERNREQVMAEVCPGVKELVAHLFHRGKLLGVASGNLERIGWVKIEAAGLREYFSFGAFCGAQEMREDIFAAGIAEARRRLGAGATVCIVGDTPSDIAAARANSVSIVAVATGAYPLEELARHGPDLCLPSCSDLLALATR